jgi:hypothetical protein
LRTEPWNQTDPVPFHALAHFLTCCGILSKSLNVSQHQLPHLENGEVNNLCPQM